MKAKQTNQKEIGRVKLTDTRGKGEAAPGGQQDKQVNLTHRI